MKGNMFLLVLLAQSCFITCQLYQYHYVGEKKSWSEAQRYCRETYTDLATVSNMTDMKRLISNKPENMTEAWIGLFNLTGVKRTWYWSLPGVEFNGSQTNWAPGEPDKTGFEFQNCVIIQKSLKWGDNPCTNTQYFLCYNESESSEKFYLIQQKKTWLEAQSYCRENYTDLVSGWNQLQDPRLSNTLSSISDDPYIFIGLFRDRWRWSDGSSFSFRHWNLTFNQVQSKGGSCVKAVFGNGGRWINDCCDNNKPFICYDDKFILIKKKMNWEEALYYCRDHYHDLVTITNLDDQRWVQEKVKNASTPFVWTGLRYTCTLGFWFWVSDEVVSYKNWVSGGPEDDCDMSGTMDTGGQHQWVKKNDNEEFNFVCSKF